MAELHPKLREMQEAEARKRKQKDFDLVNWIVAEVNEQKRSLSSVASGLGVTRQSLQNWLKDSGVRLEHRLVRYNFTPAQ